MMPSMYHQLHQSSTWMLFLVFKVLLILQVIYRSNAEADSCGPRASPRMMTSLPCDLSSSHFCAKPGAAYPWGKVRKFIHENQALMRRMYGDIRQVMVIRNEIGGRRLEDGRRLIHHPTDDDGFYRVAHPMGPLEDEEQFNKDDSAEPQETSTEFTNVVTESVDSVQVSTEGILGDLELDVDIEDVESSVTDDIPSEDTEPTIPYNEASATAIFYKGSDYVVSQQELGNRSGDRNKNTKVRGHGKIRTKLTPSSTTTSTTKSTTVTTSATTTTTTAQPTTTTTTVEPSTTQKQSTTTSTTTTPEPTTTTTTTTTAAPSTPIANDEPEIDDTYEKVNNLPPMRGVNACPVVEEVIAPYWANNTRGETLALMNIFPFEQYIHSEKCVFENRQMHCRQGCRCEQQFRLHRLLAFDPTNDCRGIFADWFRFPACCVCKCYGLNDYGFMPEKTRFSHRQGRRKSVKPIPLMYRDP